MRCFEELLKQLFHYLLVPQRVVLCYFGFLAVINAYTMRLCLDFTLNKIVSECSTSGTAKLPIAAPKHRSVANLTLAQYAERLPRFNDSSITIPDLIRLVFQEHTNSNSLIVNSTYVNADNYVIAEQQQHFHNDTCEMYDWTEQLQSVILASFYIGYIVTHIPGGLLAERHGGKWVLALGIVLSAVFTLLTPTAIRFGGPIALIAVRIMLGLCEGPTFPSVNAMLAQWVPANERGKLGVFVLSGGQVGIILVNMVTSFLFQQFEWSLAFYVFGGCALFWFIGFVTICYSHPESSPFINETEKQYLRNEMKTNGVQEMKTMSRPWPDILKNTPLWALVTSTIQYDWNQIMLATDVQNLMKDLKQCSLSESFYTSLSLSAPYIMNWIISLTSGALSDYLISRRILSVTATRRIMTATAVFGITMFVTFSAYIATLDFFTVLATLQCLWGLMGAYYAGVKLLPLDMSPNYAGTLMAIANGLGSATGIVAPYLKNFNIYNVISSEVTSKNYEKPLLSLNDQFVHSRAPSRAFASSSGLYVPHLSRVKHNPIINLFH